MEKNCTYWLSHMKEAERHDDRHGAVLTAEILAPKIDAARGGRQFSAILDRVKKAFAANSGKQVAWAELRTIGDAADVHEIPAAV